MTLAEFKGIFWWEYFHRLLGRLIGVVFLVPLLWFCRAARIPRGSAWKLFGIFVLGGLQGAMGWYMVKAGLVDDPRVSQFRLTAHLGLALLIFAAMLWVGARPAVSAARTRGSAALGRARSPARSRRSSSCMALSGGFVAGIRAGFAYNTFPLMNGHLVPPEIFMLEPWWRNFFYNMATVQFDHRLLAWLLLALVPWLWWRCGTRTRPSRARIAAHLLLGLLVAQIALGIATLLVVVPVALGAAHQASRCWSSPRRSSSRTRCVRRADARPRV